MPEHKLPVDISPKAVARAAADMRTRGIAYRSDRDIADLIEALAADRARPRPFVRSARPIVQAYASAHPKHVWSGYEQDPMGAHAWLEGESAELGTMRDGGDPKVSKGAICE